MKIKSVAHLCLKTADLQRTLEFYCGALGLKRWFNFSKEGDIIGCYLKASNETFIEVFLMSDVDRTVSGQSILNHFCLETDDIEKLHKSLTARSYTPKDLVMGADGTWQFWITDPNGLDIEFQQYTSQSSQSTAANVELKSA
jgi:catechol 2,3-dioxygenase-like lactoylglutathione lyase family enzyme